MRLASLQMQAVPGDVTANLVRIARAAREGANAGASILVTPELSVTGYGAGDALDTLAEPPDGPSVRELHALAGEWDIALVAGFAERDGEAVYNSVVFVDGQRDPLVYRKSHLYGAYERDRFTPAPPCACTVEFGGLVLGFVICYDVEFPENVRRLAQAGATLVIAPTALPVSPYSRFIARQVVPVRAFENQVHLTYVNHCGADEHFRYAGLSSIVAPDGSLLAEAGETGEALLYADIRREDFADALAQNSYLADLRV